MDTVFDVFEVTDYTFLELNQGGVLGNTIASQIDATGVLKLRDGMNVNLQAETADSDATLHIRPTEPFATGNLVGNGIRASKGGSSQDYRITGQVEGFNFDTNVLEFVKVTLKREAVAWENPHLPLS